MHYSKEWRTNILSSIWHHSSGREGKGEKKKTKHYLILLPCNCFQKDSRSWASSC